MKTFEELMKELKSNKELVETLKKALKGVDITKVQKVLEEKGYKVNAEEAAKVVKELLGSADGGDVASTAKNLVSKLKNLI